MRRYERGLSLARHVGGAGPGPESNGAGPELWSQTRIGPLQTNMSGAVTGDYFSRASQRGSPQLYQRVWNEGRWWGGDGGWGGGFCVREREQQQRLRETRKATVEGEVCVMLAHSSELGCVGGGALCVSVLWAAPLSRPSV